MSTLAVWRSTGRVHLPFVKVGGHVRYRPEDIKRFLAGETPSTQPASSSWLRVLPTPPRKSAPKPRPKRTVEYPTPEVKRARLEDYFAKSCGLMECHACGTRPVAIEASILTAAEVPGISLTGRSVDGFYCLCPDCDTKGNV